MQLDSHQLQALDVLQGGHNAFLTGSAGTGKSTVTAAFIGASLKKINVCATTGIAAINLRDQFAARSGRAIDVRTIYSFGGFGLGPKEGQSSEEFWAWWRAPMTRTKMGALKRIQNAEAVVIDEISMLPGRILNYFDFHCRQIRENSQPFGGIQVIAVGDFLQLPPVKKSEEASYDWAFQSQAWERAEFRSAVLTEVHRQADPNFVRLLNDFRIGQISHASANVLASCVSVMPPADIPRLFCFNREVDKWNDAMLNGLPGETHVYTARISGPDEQREWLIKNLVTPYKLLLRVGARVMITANLRDSATDEMLASNGTLAKVVSLPNDQQVIVRTDDDKTLELKPWMWDYDPQDDGSAKFFQIPLRPAWASTIHKCQGLTLPNAYMDIRSAREPGQAYVAISRVKTLEGIHLKAPVTGIFKSDAAIRFHAGLKTAPAPKPQLVSSEFEY